MPIRSLRLHWERASAMGACFVGVQFLVAGWYGANDSALLAEEFPYLISGGLGAALMVAIACTLWLTGDLMDEWRVLGQLDRALIDAAEHLPPRHGAAATRPTPWTVPQLLFTAISTGIAALLVAVGWFGASGQSRPSAQLGWFALGAAGIGVQGVGVGAHVLNARRSIGERRENLASSILGTPTSEVEPASGASHSVGAGEIVAAPVMTRYHRPGCALVRGKAVEASPLDGPVALGREPCGVCSPGRRRVDQGAAVGDELVAEPEMVGGAA